ncbi:MAG TPA: hypothetical protein PKJ77_09005, partial [Thermodesulfobacteriota bacterium]|nr:hypothetical protein [Thermodesulfobacteriota bacterium]
AASCSVVLAVIWIPALASFRGSVSGRITIGIPDSLTAFAIVCTVLPVAGAVLSLARTILPVARRRMPHAGIGSPVPGCPPTNQGVTAQKHAQAQDHYQYFCYDVLLP